MDPLSYLAQTEQQLSFIIARGRKVRREGEGGGRPTKRDDSPTGLIKESDIIGGGRRRGEEEEEEEESVRVVKVSVGPETRGETISLTLNFSVLFTVKLRSERLI